MADYRDRISEFTAVGARVAALSVDDPARAEAMRRELDLPFAVLCDTARAVVTAWGLLNTREHGGIAYPAVFVLDRDRVVRHRSLDRTASRVDAGAVLALLRGEPVVAKRRVSWPGLQAFVAAFRSALRRGVRVSRS